MIATRRCFSTGIAVASLSLWLPSLAQATGDGITVEVSLSATRARLGEAVYMQVKVISDGGRAGVTSEPSLPELDGLHFEPQGVSSWGQSTVFSNGRIYPRHSRTYTYALVPSKQGSFPLNVKVGADGRRVGPSHVPVLQVSGGASSAADARPIPGDVVARGETFVLPAVDKKRVYVGEPMVYTVEIWTRRSERLGVRTLPTFRDFWTEQLRFDDKVQTARTGGVAYRVHTLMKRALFPQKAGLLKIGQAEVETQTSSLRSLFAPRRRREAPRLISGPGLEVEVLPLPAEGQPSGFAPNNVGYFVIEARVDRDKVEVGEGLTLTVIVSGTGNIRFVDPGEWSKIDGARRYDPQDEFSLSLEPNGKLGGQRKYKFLIVPDRPGMVEVPRHEISFFDPESGTYRTTATEPIDIEVRGEAAERGEANGEAAQPGISRESAQDDAVFAPIVASDNLPRVAAARESWWTLRHFTVAVGSAPATVLLGWFGLSVSRRLGPDDAARQHATVLLKRKELVAKAEGAVESGDAFFPAVAELLHAQAVDVAGDEGVGLSRAHLMKLVHRRGVSPDLVARVRAVLERADAARFGVDSSTSRDRSACLREVREILDAPDWKLR
ncbi:MAG: BatD family protein [Nannocystaceae bacterium]